MKIRSITCFYDPGISRAAHTLQRLAQLAQAAAEAFRQAGYEVQTLRLATTPFPRMVPTCCDESAINLVQNLESEAASLGFTYISFGPALPELPNSYRLIPEMITATRNAFFGGLLTTPQGVSLPAVQACGEIIARAAAITPDGFANLRFAALANVPAGAPFFPAAYHQPGQPPAFALAIEAAGEAQQAFGRANSLAEARAFLLEDLQRHVEKLFPLCEALALRHQAAFNGFDFSLAPFPAETCSTGRTLESLGLPALGLSGSLAAAAFLASALDDGTWKKCGFNGLMLPVLEDAGLAARAAEGTLTLKDLLLYSAVCGTGLDTIPLPGDASAGQLSAVLLDVAALAVRLNKPLTARLMPIPGKAAGEVTAFDFGYFANSRVMPIPALPLSGRLASAEILPLHARQPAP